MLQHVSKVTVHSSMLNGTHGKAEVYAVAYADLAYCDNEVSTNEQTGIASSSKAHEVCALDCLWSGMRVRGKMTGIW